MKPLLIALCLLCALILLALNCPEHLVTAAFLALSALTVFLAKLGSDLKEDAKEFNDEHY